MKSAFLVLAPLVALLSSAVVASPLLDQSPVLGSSLEKRATCKVVDCRNKIPANSHRICTSSQTCSFSCNTGFIKSGSTCVAQCVASKCHNKIPDHSVHTCNSKNQCSWTCEGGYKKSGGGCVSTHKACKASLCKNTVPSNAHRACINSNCDFYCNPGFYRDGNVCKPNTVSCTASSQCHANHPKFAYNRCHDFLCSWVCETGYHADGYACVPNAKSCGPKAVCAQIVNGSVTCSNGKCVYKCIPGWTLSSASGNPQCYDFSTDPKNCGTVGHVCPPDYSGKGTPACHGAKCTLTCPAGESVHGSGSLSFCA